MGKADEGLILIYTTLPSIADAEDIGRKLVESKKAGCINILLQMVSLYEWEGKLERADEVVMLIKTKVSLKDEVIGEVKRLHPYDVPAILALDVTGGNEDYLGWIIGQTQRT